MNDQKRCIIIAAGDPGQITKEQLGLTPQDYIICCDGGYAHALMWDVRPHLVVGDFDSFHGTIPDDIPVQTFGAVKNDTDSILAARIGYNKGYRQFVLVAATGSRLDHTFANIQTLCWLMQQGATGYILGANETVRLLENSSITLSKRQGYSLSVFSYSPVSTGVWEEGVAYPLSDATLTAGFPLGVSNEITADAATVSVKNGTLLIMQSKLD